MPRLPASPTDEPTSVTTSIVLVALATIIVVTIIIAVLVLVSVLRVVLLLVLATRVLALALTRAVFGSTTLVISSRTSGVIRQSRK